MTQTVKVVGELQAFLTLDDWVFNLSEIIWIRRLGKNVGIRLREMEQDITITGPDAEKVWDYFQGETFE